MSPSSLARFQDRLGAGAERGEASPGDGREEERVWELLAEALAPQLGQGTRYEVLFSARCAFGYPVLARGSGPLGEGVRVHCGDAWCELRLGERAGCPSETLQVLVGLALSAHVGARARRLTRVRAEGVAFVARNFVHLVRNDVSALASLGRLAATEEAIEDRDAFCEAIGASAEGTQRSLALVRLLGDTALATQRGRVVVGDIAAALGDGAFVPAGARCLCFDADTLRELVAVPRAFLERARGPVRASARLHPDGWELTLTAADAAPLEGPAEPCWTTLGDLPLGFAAAAFNICGGRTWVRRDERAPVSLGLTVPGA